MPKRLPHCWRVSRYEPLLRARESSFETWTDISDVGSTFNGLTLEIEEYLRVEDLYVQAAMRFALDSSTEIFQVVYQGTHDETTEALLGRRLVRSDLGPLVRGNLRGTLDCVIEGVGGSCQIAFGYDLYMYVAATTPCSAAVEDVERSSLHVEPGIPPAYWENE
jgi:hypothetical protein